MYSSDDDKLFSSRCGAASADDPNMASSGRRAQVTQKLPQLQNLVKRSPQGYREEWEQQHRRFLSELEILNLNPSSEAAAERFGELASFIAATAPCYREAAVNVPAQLCSLLEQHADALQPELRTTLVQALILVRNRKLVEPVSVLKLCFTLFRIRDKTLRALLYSHAIGDIRRLNKGGHGDEKLNRRLQALLHAKLAGDDEVGAKKALDVLVELYRRGIWTDARAVNAIAGACLSPRPKVMSAAIHFFLGTDARQAAADVDDDDDENANKVRGRRKRPCV